METYTEYTINEVGKAAIAEFIRHHGSERTVDSFDADTKERKARAAWFEDAESSFSQGGCSIEIGGQHSKDRNPHTLTLVDEYFDARQIEIN